MSLDEHREEGGRETLLMGLRPFGYPGSIKGSVELSCMSLMQSAAEETGNPCPMTR